MKTVLITGANKGIGFATAKKFAQMGYNVILTGRSEDRLKKAIEKLNYEKADMMVWDISNVKIAKEKVEEAHKLFGDIDVFVNNAGIVTGRQILEEDETSWDMTMQTNLKGTYFALMEQAKYMIDNNIKGHIVMVGSLMGFTAKANAYSISKWGVRGMVYGAAKGLAPYGICVNGVAPGETATEILGQKEGEFVKINTPRGFRAMPNEIAEDIFYLSQSDNLIGTIICSDGGASL